MHKEDHSGKLYIEVGGEKRGWRQGEVLLFDDSYEHEVWNLSKAARLVLIVDMWHPMLATDAARLASLDAQRGERYLRAVRDGYFEPMPAPSSVTLSASAAPVESNTGVARLCAGLHDAPLGGQRGVQQVANSLRTFLARRSSGDQGEMKNGDEHLEHDLEDVEGEERLARRLLDALTVALLDPSPPQPAALAQAVAVAVPVSVGEKRRLPAACS